MLPPAMLAVVVMFDVEFNALITFELRLKPAAFKLPPVTLPATLANVLMYTLPDTAKVLSGAALPIPTLPLASL